MQFCESRVNDPYVFGFISGSFSTILILYAYKYLKKTNDQCNEVTPKEKNTAEINGFDKKIQKNIIRIKELNLKEELNPTATLVITKQKEELNKPEEELNKQEEQTNPDAIIECTNDGWLSTLRSNKTANTWF